MCGLCNWDIYIQTGELTYVFSCSVQLCYFPPPSMEIHCESLLKALFSLSDRKHILTTNTVTIVILYFLFFLWLFTWRWLWNWTAALNGLCKKKKYIFYPKIGERLHGVCTVCVNDKRNALHSCWGCTRCPSALYPGPGFHSPAV